MALKCKVRHIGDISILDLKGELSLAPRQGHEDNVQILEKVRSLMTAGNKRIVLNLAGVTYMDSAGIGQLIGTYTSSRSHGAQLKLLKPTVEVRKLLELTQLAKVLEIYDDEDRAVHAFSPGSAA